MALSNWYADFLLPGRNATTVNSVQDYSSVFPLTDENIIDRLSFYSSCDDEDSFSNPEIGKNKNIILGGSVLLTTTIRSKNDIFVGVKGQEESSSSSSCSSSSSSSFSSSSKSSCSSSCSSWVSSSSSVSSCSSSCSCSSSI